MRFDDLPVTTGKTYLELLRKFADKDWEKRRESDYRAPLGQINADTENFSATTTLIQPFGSEQYGYTVQACAVLYEAGYGEKYADIALCLLERTAELQEEIEKLGLSEYQRDSLRLVETAFAAGPLTSGYVILRDLGKIGGALHERMRPVLEAVARDLLRLPEWGPFNRCALRIGTLDRFARLYPESEYAEAAAQTAAFCAEDSIGRWNMEDTSFYNGIWYICIAEYLTEHNIRNARTDIIFHYYAAYVTQIMAPDGSIPDYGDAHPRDFSCSALTLGFLEWAAAVFNDGEVKYAAMKLLDFGRRYRPERLTGGWLVRSFALAARMAKTKVAPKKPEYLSGEILDDIVGKKIVMRGGEGAYMLLNYRDEAENAYTARRNMYSTIPAPAEKVHHGHADENAIVHLEFRGKTLLTDGGYRDRIVTDGHYRADFYHNRAVLRNGRMFREKGFLEYAENIGTYLHVDTRKIFYHELGNVKVSRTRLYDPHHYAVHDRTVCYFSDEGVYAVADTIRATRDYEYTIGQMWFGGKITENSPCDYTIKQTLKDFQGPKGTENLNMRVVFLDRGDKKISVEKLRRNGDDGQYALTQYYSEYLAAGEYLSFVTLLIPEDAETDFLKDSAVISTAFCERTPDGQGVSFGFTCGEKTWRAAMKMNDSHGFDDYKHRPTYSFEAGREKYGEFETDALFALFEQTPRGTQYRALMLSRLDCGGKTVFKSPDTQFSNNDLSVRPGAINFERRDGFVPKEEKTSKKF